MAFKNGAYTSVAPTSHEFALGDGLATEDRTEEIVEDVAPCCNSCAGVASAESLIECGARGDTEKKQRSGCNSVNLFGHKSLCVYEFLEYKTLIIGE